MLIRTIERFEWQFDRHSFPAYSEIFIYLTSDNRLVVIAAEPGDDYEGMSITNGVERVATEVVKRLGIQFDVFIEYYPPHLNQARTGLRRGETLDIVTFEKAGEIARFNGFLFCQPSWKHSTREAIEALVGCPLNL